MRPHFLIWSFGPKIGSVDGICPPTDSFNRFYGLRHAVVCMPERDGKDQEENIIAQSKWARAGSLALVD